MGAPTEVPHMASIAGLIIDRHEAGLAPTWDDFAAVPARQMEIWFDDLAPICPDRLSPAFERRPANALNVEIGAPAPRCADRSPDGRGRAWLHSGGSALAYGHCRASKCWRIGR